MTEPVPFDIYEVGVYLHGTRVVNHADGAGSNHRVTASWALIRRGTRARRP